MADNTKKGMDRRDFLAGATMVAGLAAGYGSLAAIAGRFLYPTRPTSTQWVFVTEIANVKVGESLAYQTPAGQKVAVARQKNTGKAEDFIALSTTCPHLGCQVHWQAQNNQFFCPCHNGAFAPDGKATAGPPKDANQSLSRYPLKIEKGMLFIRVPVEFIALKE